MGFNLYTMFLFFVLVVLAFPSQGLEEEEVSRSKIIKRKTIHGDIYDCIDIFEQPSLKHPSLTDKKALLKNLLLKFPEKRMDKEHPNYKGIWMNESCPFGTVPIQRTPTTIRMQQGTSQVNYCHQLEYNVIRHIDFAGLVTKPNPNNRFKAASAAINTYNPHVQDGSAQYSSASVIFESGGGTSLNQIQVGWIVYPEIFGDQNTRLYTSWTADGYTKTGCFNTLCPGFVQLSNTVPLGLVLPDVSHIEASQFDSNFYVQWIDGVGWAFYWGIELSTASFVGFWTTELFTSMGRYAERVKLGGQVYTPPSDKISPPMGSGRFRAGVFDITCYMRQVFLGNGTSGLSPLDNSLVDVSESRCYRVGDHEFTNDPYWKYRFIFGGRGGRDKVTCVY